MKRRFVTLRKLQKYDLENDTSIVRELEMSADAYITSPGYTIQFWTDVQTYGVDEAILYVKNGNHGDHAALQHCFDEALKRIGL